MITFCGDQNLDLVFFSDLSNVMDWFKISYLKANQKQNL